MQRCPIPVAPASAPLTGASAGGLTTTVLDECTPTDPQPNPLPTVSLTAPASGASAYAPGSFVIAASASDADGIEEVEFRANGVSLYHDRTAPYAYNWTNVGIGSYILVAVARDNRGATKSSATRTVTVKARPVVKGYVDSVPRSGSDYYVRGWACATTLPQSINVHAYVGGAAGSGTYIGSFAATVASEPAVATACQSTGTNYRYHIPLSTAVRQQHVGKKIYVHGISPVGGSNNLLTNSGVFAVPPPPRAADFVSQTVPTVMAAGKSYAVRVSMKNTGTDTWTAKDGYRLGSQNPENNGTWGLGRVAVSGSIATGATEHFYFNAKAPGSAGVYNFQWRSVDEGQAWFGDYSPNVRVTVVSGSISASPNPCIISSGSACASSISWNSSAANSEVWVSNLDGSGIQLFARAQSGTQSAPGITVAGKRFHLMSSGVTIDTVVVDGYANAGPAVTLITPTEDVTVFEPGSFNLTASASDANGIAHVDFKANGTLLHRDTTAPYEYVWTGAAVGSHLLQAVAQDKLGATKTSASTWVHVVAERSGSATANITTPSNGANYAPGASVTVQSNARPIYDGVELNTHKILHNGTVVASANIEGTTGLHTLSKTLSGLTNGTHNFASTTTTSAGHTYTSSLVTITVNALPSVSLTSPVNGASLVAPATVTLTASAADSDGSVTKVEFYNGSTRLATDTSAPYSYTWSGVPGSASQYALHAKAYDNLGLSRTSAVHKITINAKPTASISRSPSWSEMIGPATVTLGASADDSDGSIAKVEFYNGSTLLATDTAVPYSHTVTGLAPGNYSFTAKAYDNRGAVTPSTANTLKVLTRGASPGVVTRRYVYDAQHRLCKTIEPETGANIVDYDNAGNVVWTASGQPYLSSTDCERASVPLAQRVARQYDARNRVRIVDFPDNRGNTVHDYWADGAVKSIAVDDGTNLVTTTYAYNRRRLLASERLTWNTIDWQVGYGYTGNGHLASQSYPSGLSVDFAPNALGQPTRAGSYATGVSYYPNGAIKQFTYGNGIVHSLTQNARGLAERSRDAYGVTAVHDDSYDYDFNGNVAAISDGLEPHQGNRTMTYDSLDRLTKVVSPMFGGDNEAVFTYDAIDNLLYARVGEAPEAFYFYDDRNQLTNVRNADDDTVVGLGYVDEKDSLNRGNVTNKDGQLFDFDYGNRLRNISGMLASSYVYDGLGRRVGDTTNGGIKHSLYSKAGQLSYTADFRRNVDTDYIYLAGSLVATREHSGSAYTTKYHHTDALGSPVVVTGDSRQVLERNFYAPYGAQIDGPTKDGVGYTGHVMDAASGLTYMQQRYYDPSLGRFLSVDPVAPSGPRNFNRYSYAANNPYRFTDPDGRDCKSKDGTTTCSFTATGTRIATKFSFDTPKGWPAGMDSSQRSHHDYDKKVSAGPGSAGKADSIRGAVVKDPTPGPQDRPASPQGTENNATPGDGCCKLVSVNSLVKTYLRTDANGNPMAVNVTMPGHPLFPGYVARFVTTEGGAAVVHNFGEGTGWLQSNDTIGDAMFNNVWYPHSEQNIQDAR